MLKKIFKYKNNLQKFLVEEGNTILDIARQKNIDIEGSCEGSLACSGASSFVGGAMFQIVVWGDDAQTTEIDGAVSSASLIFLAIDSNGNIIWTKAYGSADNDDWGWSVFETNNKDLILIGSTKSFGASLFDVYLVGTNSKGILW